MTNKTLNNFGIIMIIIALVFIVVGSPNESALFYSYFNVEARATFMIVGLALGIGSIILFFYEKGVKK